MRIELVDEERALQLPRGGDPAAKLVALDELSGRVAGVGEEQRGEAASLDLAAQVLDGERVSSLTLEQDGNGGEGAEDVEQFFVRGVVGQEMAEVDVAERSGGAGNAARPPPEMETFSAVYCEGSPRRLDSSTRRLKINRRRLGPRKLFPVKHEQNPQ